MVGVEYSKNKNFPTVAEISLHKVTLKPSESQRPDFVRWKLRMITGAKAKKKLPADYQATLNKHEDIKRESIKKIFFSI